MPNQHKTKPITFDFTRERAKQLAEQVIADNTACGRETMLAVMLNAILEQDEKEDT